MNAADAYRAMLRDQLGPFLRAHGFKGSAPTWTHTTSTGDRAIFNAQASAWGTRDAVTFYVNLALLPAPYWAWRCWEAGSDPTRAPKDYHGMWRERLEGIDPATFLPSPSIGRWAVTDEASALVAATDVIAALNGGVLAELLSLTDREVLTQWVRAGRSWPLGIPARAVLALLLTHDDPDRELPALLDELEQTDAWFAPLVDWCRQANQTHQGSQTHQGDQTHQGESSS